MIEDDLLTNALNGRGLWIGMSAERSVQHEIYRLEIEELNHGYASLTDGTHITLAHLGKKCDSRIVNGAISACEYLQNEIFEYEAAIEGVARFTNHIVMLLAPDPINHIFDKTWSALGDRACRPDNFFAGVRHTTVSHIRKDTSVIQLPKIDKYSLTFKKIEITCGTSVMSFPLTKFDEIF